MKKEFKAPIVESRELSALGNIMEGTGILTISAGSNPETLVTWTDSTVDGFKQWKGFGEIE